MKKFNQVYLFSIYFIAMLLVGNIIVYPYSDNNTYALSWTDAGHYASSFAGGNGTSASPYQISTPAEFARMGVITSSHTGMQYYVLTKSINLAGKNWQTVDNANMTGGAASINFNGNANTIINLDVSANLYGGIFRNFRGNFHDTQFINARVYNTSAALIADQLYGTIENIQARGTVTSKNNYAGGFVVYNAPGSIIRNCSFIGDITGSASAITFTEVVTKISHSSRYYLSRGTNAAVWGYTKLKIEQKLWFNDVKYVDVNSSDILNIGGICGTGTGQVNSCYFVGNINATLTYAAKKVYENRDLPDNYGYLTIADRQSDSGGEVPVRGYGVRRRSIYWKDFRAMGLQNAAGLKSIVNKYFGVALDPNDSQQLAWESQTFYNETDYINYTGSTFDGNKASFTDRIVTTSNNVILSPYAINSSAVTNCYFQSGTLALNVVAGANRVSNMKTQNISSDWKIDPTINDGYPHLKVFYWQDAV